MEVNEIVGAIYAKQANTAVIQSKKQNTWSQENMEIIIGNLEIL